MTTVNPSLSAIFTGLKPVRQHPDVRCCWKPTATSANQSKPWKSIAEWDAAVIEWRPAGDTARTEDYHDTKGQAEAVCQILSQQGFGGERIHFPLRVWVERNIPLGCSSPSRDYFLFACGSVRRQIGQGHSRAERKARRQADILIRGMVASHSIYAIAADLVSRDPSLRQSPSQDSPPRRTPRRGRPGRGIGSQVFTS